MEKRSPEQVGELVKARRLELGITEKRMQDAAKIDSKTLKGMESGDRWPQEETRMRVEPVLRWMPGSIAALRAGEDATPMPAASAELSGSGSLTATAEASGSGNVVVQPGAARIVRLDDVPILDLVDEIRRRVVSLVSPSSHIDDVTRGFATIQDAVENEKDRAGLSDRPRQRGDGVKRRGHSPPNVG